MGCQETSQDMLFVRYDRPAISVIIAQAIQVPSSVVPKSESLADIGVSVHALPLLENVA